MLFLLLAGHLAEQGSPAVEALLEHEAAPRLLGLLQQKFDAVCAPALAPHASSARCAVPQRWHHQIIEEDSVAHAAALR